MYWTSCAVFLNNMHGISDHYSNLCVIFNPTHSGWGKSLSIQKISELGKVQACHVNCHTGHEGLQPSLVFHGPRSTASPDLFFGFSRQPKRSSSRDSVGRALRWISRNRREKKTTTTTTTTNWMVGFFMCNSITIHHLTNVLFREDSET